MDKRIARILNAWKIESGLNEVIRFKYDCRSNTLTIYASRIGFLIGRAGVVYNKYREILKEEIHGFDKINFVEVSSYEA